MRRLILFALCVLPYPTGAEAQASETAIAAVVSQWKTPPSSAGALRSLVFESAELRDARVLGAALGAVQSPTNPQQVRVAGLQVLLTFAMGRASAVSSPEEITDPDSLQLVGATTEIQDIPRAQPVTTEILSSLIPALHAISTSDPDSGVRIAAARVRRQAEYAAAPKPTLAYVCRNKFRIRSTSSLDTFVEYAVAGTGETGRIYVARREPNADYTDTFFVTDERGTVKIFSIEGKLVATAKNRRTRCPK